MCVQHGRAGVCAAVQGLAALQGCTHWPVCVHVLLVRQALRVPSSVVEFVVKALDPSPAARFPSAATALEALGEC